MTVTEALALDGKQRMVSTRVFPRRVRYGALRVSQVRTAIDRFKETGKSDHSSNATLLPYIIAWCEENDVQYRLTAITLEGRRAGYCIEQVSAEELSTQFASGSAA